MNICLFTKTTLAHGLGGVEVHVETLSKTVPQLGHSLTIIASKHPDGVPTDMRNRCQTYYLPRTKVALYSHSFWRENVQQFMELHKQTKFDIVWAEDFSGYYYAWKIRPRLEVPILSIIQGSSLKGYLKSEWNRVNTLSELSEFATKFVPEALLRYSFWYRRTLNYSDMIVAVSHETAQMFEQEFDIPSQKITTIFNSVDVNRFQPDPIQGESIRKQYAIGKTTKLILMAAVIHKQKGMQIGLKAFKGIKRTIPNSKMMIVGNGEHLDFLKQLTYDLKLTGEVIFCGAVPNEQMAAYYNACDLFLNPTLRWEGLPITTVEAMACGKPIVISRAGGTQSTIEDGISGFFVDVGDVDMIEKKCTEMLSNTSLAEKMGHNACNRAVSQFGQEQMVEDLLSVSEKLIKHASSVTQSRSRWQEVVNNSSMRRLDDITLKSTAPIREREDLEIDFNRTAATFLRYDWAARTLCRRLPAMSNILEVGCGLGLGTCLFNSLGFKVTGVDASSETIDEARRRFPWLNFKKALAEEFTMPQSYDAIVALEVLEHISDWKRVVQNWKSSLKEGGILVLSTPNRVFNSENPHSPRNRFHLHEFSIDELQTLFPNCQVRGISLRIFKSRFDNLLVRSLFFLLTLTISPFELKRSFVGGAENFSRRDLIYGKLGYWFPQWSGGFLLTWKKDG